MKKNRAIEFWRFLYTMFVVFAHTWLCTNLNEEPNAQKYIFCSAGFVVEFFFMLSGFLLMERCAGEAHSNPFGEGIRYIIKRILRFAPLYYLTLALILLYRVDLYRSNGMGLEEIKNYLKSIWPEYFMLNGVYYYDNQANISTWYISALLPSSLVVYWVAAFFLKQGRKPLFPLTVLSVLGAWIYYSGRIPGAWAYNFRALYCVALGAVSWEGFSFLKKKKWTTKNKFGAMFLESICVVWALSLVPWRPVDVWTRLVVFPFVGIIVLSFLCITPLSRLLDNPVSNICGKLSFGIYMGHMTVLLKFGWRPPFSLKEAHPLKVYTMVGAAAVLYGAFLMLLLALCRWGVCAAIEYRSKRKR